MQFGQKHPVKRPLNEGYKLHLYLTIQHSVNSRMGGAEAPVDWQGGLNLTYNLGPGLDTVGWKVKMDVHTSNTPTTIYNVVAMMQGSEEPG